jgi:hypothetical protein
MPTKPPNIVHSDYRPKRARKRKQSVAIPADRHGAAMPPKRCFENSCAGPRAMAGRKHPERYWRSYGDDPLPAGAVAMDHRSRLSRRGC